MEARGSLKSPSRSARMRVVRPLLLLGLPLAFVALAFSDPVPGGGYNQLDFAKGSPAPTKGGVDVSVNQKPTAGYTCVKITVRVVDVSNGQTLDKCDFVNP